MDASRQTSNRADDSGGYLIEGEIREEKKFLNMQKFVLYPFYMFVLNAKERSRSASEVAGVHPREDYFDTPSLQEIPEVYERAQLVR